MVYFSVSYCTHFNIYPTRLLKSADLEGVHVFLEVKYYVGGEQRNMVRGGTGQKQAVALCNVCLSLEPTPHGLQVVFGTFLKKRNLSQKTTASNFGPWAQTVFCTNIRAATSGLQT